MRIWPVTLQFFFAGLLSLAADAHAQGPPNQFGLQDRANAARRMIVLAVQQGISSLPPAAAQSFSYEYDADSDGLRRSQQPGPTVLRSPRTLRQGKLVVRANVSYFELSDTFGAIDYLVEFEEPFEDGSQPTLVAGFGLGVGANVTLINLATSFGIMRGSELSLHVPIVIVQARASQLSSVILANADSPVGTVQAAGPFLPNPLSGDSDTRAAQVTQLRTAFSNSLAPPYGDCSDGPDRCLTFRSDPVGTLDVDFPDGTQLGIGRIGLAGKSRIFESPHFQLALAAELLLPSPNEDRFAGTDSFAVQPLLIGQWRIPVDLLAHLLFDVGYEHDFSEAELRRAVWHVGAAIPFRQVSFDVGLAGSHFDRAVRWSPNETRGVGPGGLPVKLTALEGTSLGKSFIDLIAGTKVELVDQLLLAGAVTVPLSSDGLRPAAFGTIALEYSF